MSFDTEHLLRVCETPLREPLAFMTNNELRRLHSERLLTTKMLTENNDVLCFKNLYTLFRLSHLRTLSVCLFLCQCDLSERRQVRLNEIEELYEKHDFIGWTETSAKVSYHDS